MTSPAPRTVATPDVTDKLLRERPVWGPFIGGAFIDEPAAATIPVLEPSAVTRPASRGPVDASSTGMVASTGTRLADLVTADAAAVDRAVKDARRAYEETWRDLSPKE